MATSPLVRRASAAAGDGWASRRPAPMAPTPTAAPLTRNERRSVKRRDGSMSSTIFSFRNCGEQRVAARGYDGPNDAADVVRHNRPFRLPDRARRSEANPRDPHLCGGPVSSAGSGLSGLEVLVGLGATGA